MTWHWNMQGLIDSMLWEWLSVLFMYLPFRIHQMSIPPYILSREIDSIIREVKLKIEDGNNWCLNLSWSCSRPVDKSCCRLLVAKGICINILKGNYVYWSDDYWDIEWANIKAKHNRKWKPWRSRLINSSWCKSLSFRVTTITTNVRKSGLRICILFASGYYLQCKEK